MGPAGLILKTLGLATGWAGTQLSLMALAGPYIEGLGLRFAVALTVSLVVPALIADRLLPETDPKPKGLVTTVFALAWMGFAGLFVLATGSFGQTRLSAEGDRLGSEGYTGLAQVSYFLAGGRPAPSTEAVATDQEATTPTGPAVSAAPPAPSVIDTPSASDEPTPAPETEGTATAQSDSPAPKVEGALPPMVPPADQGDCRYPEGPYGIAEGATLSPTLQWEGIVPGADEPVQVHMRDLYDCKGDRGIDAIIIDTSQFG